jgi:CubicO group peptidase (beta-lactamase class C family)
MYRQTIAAIVMMPITFTLASGVAQAQNPTRSTAQIDQALRAAIERKDVPGIVALVTDRKGVVYQGAFGVADVATGRPLSADALFRIASMTKAITSPALMQLVEQGKLALDDPARSTCRSWRSCRCSTPSMPRPETIICHPHQSP